MNRRKFIKMSALATPLVLLCLGIMNAFSPNKALAQARIDPNKAFRIGSLVSGMCWDVPSSNFRANVRIQQFPCHTKENQQWRLHAIDGNIQGVVIRTIGRGGSFCVTRNNANNLELQLCNLRFPGNQNQLWSMREVLPNSLNNTRSIRLINMQNNECADVPAGNLSPITLNTFQCNNGANQAWVLLPMTP